MVNGSIAAQPFSAAIAAAEEPGVGGPGFRFCLGEGDVLSVWLHVQNRTYPRKNPQRNCYNHSFPVFIRDRRMGFSTGRIEAIVDVLRGVPNAQFGSRSECRILSKVLSSPFRLLASQGHFINKAIAWLSSCSGAKT